MDDSTRRPASEGADVLDDLEALLVRYVAFPSPAGAVATTLWAAHAHAVLAFESTPRLAVLSAEKGSGKTRLLEVLEVVVPRPMHAVNLSPAALFRTVGVKQPTLLMDEADSYLGPMVAKDHEELRGLINAGHRKGAVAYRCVGEPSKMEVREFPAFAAVALAGIGRLPDTILDRSVLIRMRRRAPAEHVEPYRRRRVAPQGAALRKRLAAWAEEHFDQLQAAEPAMPPGLTDRPADVWEPLLAVADAAGADWPERARAAAVELNAARADADRSYGTLLLADLRRIFDAGGVDRLSSKELVERLCAIEESPWADLRGRPLDARGLAWRLRAFDVQPSTVRFDDGTKKGYLREWFFDAWARYLSAADGGPVTDTVTAEEAPRPPAPPPLTSAVTAVTAVTAPGGWEGGEDWRRGDDGVLSHPCETCHEVLTCRRHAGRWCCSHCRPQEEAS
jgi:hypothetical protein